MYLDVSVGFGGGVKVSVKKNQGFKVYFVRRLKTYISSSFTSECWQIIDSCHHYRYRIRLINSKHCIKRHLLMFALFSKPTHGHTYSKGTVEQFPQASPIWLQQIYKGVVDFSKCLLYNTTSKWISLGASCAISVSWMIVIPC